MMTVTVTILEAAGPTVSEKKRPCCCGHPTRHPGPHRSSSKQQARGMDREHSFGIGAILSTQAPTSC